MGLWTVFHLSSFSTVLMRAHAQPALAPRSYYHPYVSPASAGPAVGSLVAAGSIARNVRSLVGAARDIGSFASGLARTVGSIVKSDVQSVLGTGQWARRNSTRVARPIPTYFLPSSGSGSTFASSRSQLRGRYRPAWTYGRRIHWRSFKKTYKARPYRKYFSRRIRRRYC